VFQQVCSSLLVRSPFRCFQGVFQGLPLNVQYDAVDSFMSQEEIDGFFDAAHHEWTPATSAIDTNYLSSQHSAPKISISLSLSVYIYITNTHALL